jgi:hypothetical protein
MKDSRKGETLWSQWAGHGYATDSTDSVVFFTEDHIDIHNEIVRRALASAIQRDGTVHSLGEAFSLLDGTVGVSNTYAGLLDGDTEYTICDKNGTTIYEDTLEEVIPITVVEIHV